MREYLGGMIDSLKGFLGNTSGFFKKIIDKIKKIYTDSARRSFIKNTKTRISLFKVLISSMNYKDSIKNSITKRREKLAKRHQKKNYLVRRFSKPGAKEMPFLNHVNAKLLEGNNFAEATKGWLTVNEQMLIESGSSGDLGKSIGMALSLLEKISVMRKIIYKSMAYPIVLLVVFLVMILAFSFKIMPLLVSISDTESWTGSQLALYEFCLFFEANVAYILATMFVISVIVFKTLPFWTGRIRYFFDNISPWSIYKELNAGIFLISLSSLIESGNTPLQAFQKLKKQSSRYVEYEIDKMIKATNRATPPAEAINTGFLGDIGDDIEDISEHGDFQKILKSYGQEAIEQIIENIERKTNNIKNLLMAFVVGFMIWGYTSFISISQSATSSAVF